jgi:hypothetical protein
VNTLEQVGRLVAASEVQGRSLVPDIFQGMNPHGPSSYYLALFDGWFNARQEGMYEFATVSSGASYLQIDGRLVAQWLGRHDPHGGRRGEHGGRLSLKPGAHRIDYLQVQFDGGPAAVAAWRPPRQERLDVMPPSAFLPLARFRAASFEAAPSSPEPVKGNLLALVDTSSAMDVADDYRQPRVARARQIVHRWQRALPADIRVEELEFDTSIHKPGPASGSAVRGTDLAGCLRALSERADIASCLGVVLLTDSRHRRDAGRRTVRSEQLAHQTVTVRVPPMGAGYPILATVEDILARSSATLEAINLVSELQPGATALLEARLGARELPIVALQHDNSSGNPRA